MPSTTRKRSRQNASCEETKNSREDGGQRQRKESLASKLSKRMLSHSDHVDKDLTDRKAEDGRDLCSRLHAQKDGNEDSVRCDKAVLCNFKARQTLPTVCSSRILQRLHGSLNVAHYLYAASLGSASCLNKQSVVSPVVRELEDLSLFRTASPFDRRITALEWHPTHPTMVVAGSKGGDIILWNSLQQNLTDHFIQGIGAGGSIQAVKFWPWNSDLVLTASIDGRVTLNDFEGKNSRVLSDTFNCHEGPGGNISGIKFHPCNSQAMYTSSLDGRLTLHDLTGRRDQVFLNTFTWDYWYCCVDVSSPRKVVVTGDNVGNTVLLSLDGKKLWTHRLHKQKVTHAEFSPREDWLFCTASTDHTVKVWDIRMVAGRESALYELTHDKPVNSAYFSRTDGCRLLTTDQHSQIRIYSAPQWHLERTMQHPHRFFQHITPIKASWHPLQDLVVVGRYPSPDFPGYAEGERRTIDILDGNSGKMVCQLHDPSAPGIVSLNKFNHRGDFLVSGMGVNMLLWGRSMEVEERQQSLLADSLLSGLDPNNGGRSRNRPSNNPRSRPPSSKQTKTKKDVDVKMKLGIKCKTKTKTHK